MSELKIRLQDIHPVELFGPNNQNLKLLQRSFPKVRIFARGHEVTLIGEGEEVERLAERVRAMIRAAGTGDGLSEDVLVNIISEEIEQVKSQEPKEGFILRGLSGSQITAKTVNQKKLVTESLENDIVFAIGPAGTGKTYTAVALAVRALKNKEVRRIILTRPAVEAGESLGFLPGDLKDKIDPYLRPLYDALDDMIPPEKLRYYMENRIIEVAPLAFMRGRTLNQAFVILDEAQNTTHNQLKMFLTRMGPSARMIINGDLTQIDLPRRSASGLPNALDLLTDIPGIGLVRFDTRDVIRHQLVKRIIKAYGEAAGDQKENG